MKKSLLIALALMLVLAFATSAMAAQVQVGNSYMSTTETAYTLPGAGTTASTVYRVYANSKFTADGKTNYPYEIYLPNELTPANYRIHTSYTKNTDACASCHATHTAVNGMLLQWYSAYETCMACHDGTVTTTYNVTTGEVGQAKTLAAGGMFGTGAEASLSNHNVSGALEITAAPGGSLVATRTSSSGSPLNWQLEFGCESCHDPHGAGGNARVLKADPNYAATDLAIRNGWGPFDSKVGIGSLAGITATRKGTLAADINKNGIGAAIGNGKQYFTADFGKYTAASWVYSYGPTDNSFTFYKPNRSYAFAVSIDGALETFDSATYGPTNWYIDNSTGVTRAIYLGTLDLTGKIVKFYGVPTLKVTMGIKNYLSQVGGASAETVTHVSGMNNFCGACHTDYNTASQEVYYSISESTGLPKKSLGGAYAYDTGVYSKAHRHTVGTERTLSDVTKILDYEFSTGVTATKATGTKGIFTCLTCHVAHGTGYEYWKKLLVDTNQVGPSGDVWTTGEIVELAGSSALKRLPNMGTCETCHNKENGQDGYAANSSIGALPAVTHVDATAGITDLGQSGATFVGSAKCEPCHAETYATYQNTAHSNMTDNIEGNTAEQDKWYAFLTNATNNYPTAGNGDIEIEAKTGDIGAGTVTDVTYTFSKADFVLSVSWNHNTLAAVSTANGVDANGKLFILFEEEAFTEVEEYGCISCHNTPKNAATSNWAAFKTGIVNKTLEPGIQCETSGCHGNGSKHVASPSAKNIKNPGTYSIKAQSEGNSCGECHGSKHHNGEFWGGKVTAGVMAAGWTDWNNQREGAGATPWEEVQQAPSAMYTGQIVSCITCHSPHSNEVQDISRNGLAKKDLQLKMPVRALCNGCHENRIIAVNNDFGKASLDKYLPLKANGMPSHLFNGKGYPTMTPGPTAYDPSTVHEWRTGEEDVRD